MANSTLIQVAMAIFLKCTTSLISDNEGVGPGKFHSFVFDMLARLTSEITNDGLVSADGLVSLII